MNITQVLILIIAGFIILGVVLFAASLRFLKNDTVNKRIQFFITDIANPGLSQSKSSMAGDSISGSLFNRTITSYFRNLVIYLGRFSPQSSIEETNRKLSVAGIDFRASEFYGVRLFFLILGLAVDILLFLVSRRMDTLMLLSYVGIPVLFYLVPVAWLDSNYRGAQNEIRGGLPDALDMLSVCTYAGLGFDQSLQRVTEYWQTPLGVEFQRVVSEMELGVSRSRALRNMSERLQIAELSAFVAVIIQAEYLGMPITEVLHGQAEQMRVLRQFKAKEIANRLPAKMMIPLALLILPALMAVILAPLIPALMDLGGGI
jgi:tight adherence protein C